MLSVLNSRNEAGFDLLLLLVYSEIRDIHFSTGEEPVQD